MKRVWPWLLLFLVLLPWEVIRAEADTLRPDGDGNYDGFWSSIPSVADKYTTVDEVSVDDADYIYETDTADAINRQSFTLAATSAYGTIDSVVVHYRGSVNASQHECTFVPFLRLDGTDNDGTGDTEGAATLTNWSQTIGRPGGGSWTLADIGSLEAGVEYNAEVDGGVGDPYGIVTWFFVVVWYTPLPDLPQVIMVG